MVRGSDVVHDGIMSVTKYSAQVVERILVAALLASLLLVSSASALLCTAASGIAVAPADDLSDRLELLRSVGGTIHPGEHQTIWKSVPSDVRTVASQVFCNLSEPCLLARSFLSHSQILSAGDPLFVDVHQDGSNHSEK